VNMHSAVLEKTKITITVPCYNEEAGIANLFNHLASALDVLNARYDTYLLFIDDGSRDSTYAALKTYFGGRKNCSIIRHPRNRGIMAALKTGLETAETEIVCSMDADCSYDPALFEKMIPLMFDGADIVTASPYHPDGCVVGVSPLRISASKLLSRTYDMVLRQKIHTYTSCFRVCRKGAVSKLSIQHMDFVGIAEMLVKAGRAGMTIMEYPAVLTARNTGSSKMNLIETVAGHCRLILELIS